jgi:hypothetical protein
MVPLLDHSVARHDRFSHHRRADSTASCWHSPCWPCSHVPAAPNGAHEPCAWCGGGPGPGEGSGHWRATLAHTCYDRRLSSTCLTNSRHNRSAASLVEAGSYLEPSPPNWCSPCRKSVLEDTRAKSPRSQLVNYKGQPISGAEQNVSDSLLTHAQRQVTGVPTGYGYRPGNGGEASGI